MTRNVGLSMTTNVNLDMTTNVGPNFSNVSFFQNVSFSSKFSNVPESKYKIANSDQQIANSNKQTANIK